MIFLIEYNRPKGQLVDFQRFDDSRRQEAIGLRFKRELELHQNSVADHEVVLLEAENEEAIRKSHRRYFETLEEFLKTTVDSLGA